MNKQCFAFFAWQKKITAPGTKYERLRPVADALENFFLEDMEQTKGPPHIRDAVDVKRWMFLVIYALVPAIFMAIWNTGVQKFVYGSYSRDLVEQFILSSQSFSGYFSFVTQDGRFWTILGYGLSAFLPVMLVSYISGGLVEVIFAVIRKKPIEEGLLVTGMLFALILPPTIPLWMVAFGSAAGIFFGKELFGGTGMNIVNPALCCRIILFFSFPLQMTGDIWVGTDVKDIKKSLQTMNVNRSSVDGFTQATPLTKLAASSPIKTIDVDAIATSFPGIGSAVRSKHLLDQLFQKYARENNITKPLGDISLPVLEGFVTSSVKEGGLGLGKEIYGKAVAAAKLHYGQGILSNGNLFFGNRLGSMGETSTFAALLGAIILVVTGVGSLRIMVSVLLSAYVTALSVQMVTYYFLPDHGAFANAVFSFPAYKHLIMGGFVFGAIFMATDPVSSPALPFGKIIYGCIIGFLTMIIRIFNPAYPEGTMLAIFFANIIAPSIDAAVAAYMRRGTYVST